MNLHKNSTYYNKKTFNYKILDFKIIIIIENEQNG
jgi:hypothetical protein